MQKIVALFFCFLFHMHVLWAVDPNAFNQNLPADAQACLDELVVRARALSSKGLFTSYVLGAAIFDIRNALYKGACFNFLADDQILMRNFLRNAVFSGDIYLTRALLAGGADINAGRGNCLGTALHTAVRQANVALVKFLLAVRARLDVRDRFDKTPLDCVNTQLSEKKELLHKTPCSKALCARVARCNEIHVLLTNAEKKRKSVWPLQDHCVATILRHNINCDPLPPALAQSINVLRGSSIE